MFEVEMNCLRWNAAHRVLINAAPQRQAQKTISIKNVTLLVCLSVLTLSAIAQKASTKVVKDGAPTIRRI